MFSKGLIEDKERVLELLELGEMERFWEENRQDYQRAHEENRMMADTGAWIAPRDFDDHKKHDQVHKNFQKSPEFSMLPPTIQQLLSDHRNVHGLLVQQQMGALTEESGGEATAPVEAPQVPTEGAAAPGGETPPSSPPAEAAAPSPTPTPPMEGQV
jgi:hypothetical protein